ncbi:hypothetical protein QAD02_019252 [Eretmocerus hayati]|uniref:Uncharacterized protein n=1 Tax=Eretmocerus hayati TaxID=131215 RepID=A0ACC2PNU9_9HYME|nr:hypothetical protein QAD02_019252 [Eretmocerus hayati]
MPEQCMVCRHVGNSRDSSRSFHKFPSKHEPRQKWMNALRVDKVLKRASVCSDHFDVSCFHDTDGYTFIRRLKSTAVPTLRLNYNTETVLHEVVGNGYQFQQTPENTAHTLVPRTVNQDPNLSCLTSDSPLTLQPANIPVSNNGLELNKIPQFQDDNASTSNSVFSSLNIPPAQTPGSSSNTSITIPTDKDAHSEKAQQNFEGKRPCSSSSKKIKPTRKLIKKDIKSTASDNATDGSREENFNDSSCSESSANDVSRKLKKKHEVDDDPVPIKRIRIKTGPFKYAQLSVDDFNNPAMFQVVRDALKYKKVD